MEQINFGTVLAVTDKFALFIDENMVDMYKADIKSPEQKTVIESMVGTAIQFNTDYNNEVLWAIAEQR